MFGPTMKSTSGPYSKMSFHSAVKSHPSVQLRPSGSTHSLKRAKTMTSLGQKLQPFVLQHIPSASARPIGQNTAHGSMKSQVQPSEPAKMIPISGMSDSFFKARPAESQNLRRQMPTTPMSPKLKTTASQALPKWVAFQARVEWVFSVVENVLSYLLISCKGNLWK